MDKFVIKKPRMVCNLNLFFHCYLLVLSMLITNDYYFIKHYSVEQLYTYSQTNSTQLLELRLDDFFLQKLNR